jgi:hypothetical protein
LGCGRHTSGTTTRTVVLELEFRVGLSGNRRWLGGNAPENHSSGLLDGFQTLAQKIGVSMPELDVIGIMFGPT